MALSSLPAPSSRVLSVILVKTALSISEGIIRSILYVDGIHLSSSSSSGSAENPLESFDCHVNTTPDSYIEEFRSRTPASRFDTVCSCKRPQHNCSVCLTQFEPKSEINGLYCGHLFHKVCLEKWLNYWNVTCPLCRPLRCPKRRLPAFGKNI